MAISTPTFKPLVGVGATNKKITNLSLSVADTEISHTLQDNLKGLFIRSRTPAVIKFSFTAMESGTKYITINKGAVLFLTEIEFSDSSVYLQSPTVTTVEILELYT